jgi:hypothetical protein
MASITQRRTKSGQLRYFVAVRIKGQPAVRETFHGKAAAKEWARNVEDGLRFGRLAPRPEAEKHPLADAIDRYLEDHLVDLGSESGRAERRRQPLWWKKRLGPLSMAHVTPAALSDARRELLKKVAGPTSNRYLAALSAVLRHASPAP